MELIPELKSILNNDSNLKYYDLNISQKENSLIIEGNVSLYYHKQILSHILIDFMQKNQLKYNIQNNVDVKSESLYADSRVW